MTRQLQMAPSIMSKFNTLMQILLVLAVVLDQVLSLPKSVMMAVIGLTLFTTVASGLGYVIEWSARARKEIRRSP
jgi:cardiolipin synthase